MPTTNPKTTKADAAAAARKMTTKAKSRKADPMLGDHPDTLGIIHRAMVSAANTAVAENDRLGIPTPGSKDGKIVYRTPPKKRGSRVPDAG
jgi:hypothetical protein